MADQKETPASTGLRGQSAGSTAICTVGEEGAGLTYRGYQIADLAKHATFEEVAYLLVYGKLPSTSELADYQTGLMARRQLPAPLRAVLEQIPASAHPMDVMRTAASMLGNLETENDAATADAVNRLIALLPAIIVYWYRYSHDGVRIETDRPDVETVGGHFLAMLHDRTPEELHAQVMNVSLILYAEHEFNASTFTARVCASTLSDLHSCVTGAIGSLRGRLHGGANEAAMEMLQQWSSPDAAEQGLLGMLERKEKIMGFGHAIYRTHDPRNAIIRHWAEKLADHQGDRTLFDISERVESVMWREKRLFANADFYHASAYHDLGIPTKLFTPLFVCSRVTGWAAHIQEQRENNRIIRPSADYVGPDPKRWLPIGER